MQNLILALVGLILVIVAIGLPRYILRHDNDKTKERGKLKYPTFFRFIPFLALITMGCIFIMSIITKTEEWLPTLIVSLIIEIPTSLFSIFFSLWEVDVQEDRFIYRNFIGRKKTYLFNDIEEKEVGKWYSKITKKKIFSMPYFIPDAGLLRRRYKKFCLGNKG